MASNPYTTAFPSQSDVYIPGFNGSAQARLIVSYARDPKKFAVNGLVTRTPTQQQSGLWLVLRPEALARVFQDPNAYEWRDGQPFPTGTHNAQDFRSVSYTCVRRGMPDFLGNLTEEQAVWPIRQTKQDNLAHLMMTLRATVFYNLMLNPLNHLSSHVKTATQWSSLNGATGGGWAQGTESNPIIQRTLKNIANQIRTDTLAAVNYKDLTLVIDPTAAIIMAASQEIHSYLARSQFAFKQITGDENQNGEWGLPAKLYDMNLVVDPTLQTISGRLTVPGTFQDVMNYNTALVMAAPGALKENVGQVNSGFSSVHMFVYRGQEMVVKSKQDDWNAFEKLGIFETYSLNIVAPETCGLATSLFV